jgi:hypothetical protein
LVKNLKYSAENTPKEDTEDKTNKKGIDATNLVK